MPCRECSSSGSARQAVSHCAGTRPLPAAVRDGPCSRVPAGLGPGGRRPGFRRFPQDGAVSRRLRHERAFPC